MKISGFTIIKNAVINDYVVEKKTEPIVIPTADSTQTSRLNTPDSTGGNSSFSSVSVQTSTESSRSYSASSSK